MTIDAWLNFATFGLDAEGINTIANYILLLAFLPAMGCLLLYGLGSRWWTSALGSILFALFAAVTLIIAVVLASIFFPNYAGREIVRIVAYPTLPIAFTAMFVVILLERRGQRRGPRE